SGGPSVKGSGKEMALKAKIVAAADDRTNTVVVTAPADTLKVIDGVVKLLDANPVTSAEIQVFQLQYADPERAGKLLESIFQPTVLQGSSSGSSSSTGSKAPGAVDAARKL